MSNNAAKNNRRSNKSRRAETRAALLSAAIDVISDVGFASGTTTMIADRANVTRGALQYHFDSKEDLISAVIDHAFEQINFKLDVAALREKSIDVRVDEIVSSYRAAYMSPTFVAAIQILLGVRKDSVLSESVAEQFDSSRTALNEIWVELFPEASNDPGKLNSLRRITMSVIRGYVIVDALGARDYWKLDEAFFRTMLKEQINEIVGEDRKGTKNVQL